MSATWTSENVLAMAPDAASASAGRSLANRRKWVTVGRDDRSAWGLCQGSGAQPYRVALDLAGVAFNCSCPSRKFPCKHGLGLGLLFADAPTSFANDTCPEWVADWLAKREQRAESAANKSDRAPTDDIAAAPAKPSPRPSKAAAERQAKIDAGIEELTLWLRDLTRNGLVEAEKDPLRFGRSMAARLVDAQAPGLARLVRDLADGVGSRGDWPSRLVERLGRLYLIVSGYQHIEALPAEVAADVRTAIGWTQSQEEALASPVLRDHWHIVGRRVEDEDQLWVQRTWLVGEASRRPALVLSFAHGSQPLDTTLVPGTVIDAELVFFTSNLPLRALVKTRHGMVNAADWPGQTIESAMQDYAEALARLPWLERWPMVLREVTPIESRQDVVRCVHTGHTMPMRVALSHAWVATATASGRPATIAGEWDGDHLTLLGMMCQGGHTLLASTQRRR